MTKLDMKKSYLLPRWVAGVVVGLAVIGLVVLVISILGG